MEIKDKILFDKNYRMIKELSCYGCNSQEHIVEHCNKTLFDKTNIYIVHNYNYSRFQERNTFDKRKKKEFKSVKKQFEIKEQASKYAYDNNLFDSSCDLSYDSQAQPNQQESDEYNENDYSVSIDNSIKERQLSPVLEEKTKVIKRRKQSLRGMKSFDITSISENIEESKRLDDSKKLDDSKRYIERKKIEDDLTHQIHLNKLHLSKHLIRDNIENGIDEEMTLQLRSKAKSQIFHSHHKYMKKGSTKIINIDQEPNIMINSPMTGVEFFKREQQFISPKNYENFSEKARLNSIHNNTARDRDRTPRANLLSEGQYPFLQRKSILVTEKEENNNLNQTIQGLQLNNKNFQIRPSLQSQILRRIYHQQHQQLQDDLQQDDYFEWKFDKMQEFQNYYIYFNYMNVLKRFHTYVHSRQLKKKKAIRSKTKIRGTVLLKNNKYLGVSSENNKFMTFQSTQNLQDDK